MLRTLPAFLGLGVWLVAIRAAAQLPTDEPTSEDQQPAQAGTGPAATEEPTAKPAAEKPTAKPKTKEEPAQAATEPPAPPPTPEVQPVWEKPEGWHTVVTGYFRAPFAMGISRRPGPETFDGATHSFSGKAKTQVSYGPNRTIDANYYSFAYTRLQEQDWVELFIHEKKKHIDAVVGWMGYWYNSAGFRNPDAAWIPGMAYLTLDTDFDIGIKPNVALTAGAWWPSFGYVEKYDTYTLGRFRFLGEQVKLAIPLSPDLKVTLAQGFGTGRDGSFNYGSPPPYQATVGLDLLHYENLQFTWGKYVDVGLHYNTQWTRDPNLFQTNEPGKSFAEAARAHLITFGGEANLSAPYAGRLWISPSYVHVRQGWALAKAGVELMHGIGGEGIATNYLAWTNNPPDSTGSGSMFNLGFLYENSLSRVLGKPPGRVMPDVTASVFGLLADVKLDLPPTATADHFKRIKQFKYGADLTLQALKWLGVMARYDEVNYELDHPGYIFSAITGRLIFTSHFLSSERIYLQYSRYRYGDKMVLNGAWPWGGRQVQGSNIFQSGPYSGLKPDMDVVKVQAEVAF